MIKKCEHCSRQFTWWEIQKSSMKLYEDLKCKKCNTSYEGVGNEVIIIRFIVFILSFGLMVIKNGAKFDLLPTIMILHLLLEPYFVKFKKIDNE